MSTFSGASSWAKTHQTQAGLAGVGAVLVVILGLHAKSSAGTSTAAAPTSAQGAEETDETAQAADTDNASLNWIYAIQGVQDLKAQVASQTGGTVSPAPVAVRLTPWGTKVGAT